MNVSTMLRGATLLVSKHKSAILAGTAIVSGVATTVLAVRATTKAMQIIQEEEAKRMDLAVESTHGSVEIKHEEIAMTKTEVVKAVWKNYIPVVLTTGVTITSIIFAHKVDAKRIAAATAALAISETAYKELQDKTIVELGEEKFKEIRQKISQDKIDNHPPKASRAANVAGEEKILFKENITGNAHFWSTWTEVGRMINELNEDALQGCGVVTLNDLLDKFGCEQSNIGDSLGWDITKGLISYTYDSCITPDSKPCIVLQFNRPYMI